jgi:hypothetical protein
MNGDGIEWFSNNDIFLITYEKKTPQNKKLLLVPYLLDKKSKAIKRCDDDMMKSVNDKNKEQQMNLKQEENWMSVKEIKTYEPLLVKAKLMLSKNQFSMNQL